MLLRGEIGERPSLDQIAVAHKAAKRHGRRQREANAIEAATLALKNMGVVPVHHQIATWAMKKGLTYTGRTDEFTFAHDVKPQ